MRGAQSGPTPLKPKARSLAFAAGAFFPRGSLLSLLVLLAITAPRSAAAQSPRESQIKAVLLFKLIRFVDWPASAFPETNSPFVIGIIGKDPFGPALDDAVAGEKLYGRKIIVERYSTPGAGNPCQILFIADSARPRLKEILDAQKGQPVLTVSEMDGFAGSLGGMVRLYINTENKPRLQINPQLAQSANLHISSKLLQLADLTKSAP